MKDPPPLASRLNRPGLTIHSAAADSVGALAVGKGRKDSHDHLLAGKQGVADELAGAQSNLSVGHFCGMGMGSMVVEKVLSSQQKQKKKPRGRRANSTDRLGCVGGLCCMCLACLPDVEPLLFIFCASLCNADHREFLRPCIFASFSDGTTYHDLGYTVGRSAASDSSVPQAISAAARYSEPDLAFFRDSSLITSSRMDIRESLPSRQCFTLSAS